MKKIIVLLLLFSFVVFPVITLAAGTTDIPAAQTLTNVEPIPDTSVENTITFITNWLFAIFLIVAVWFFIWAGFTFVTANGDTEKVNKARNQVMYGVIGVLVAVMAKGLVGLAFSVAQKPN